jgi:hypothetical protein
MPQNRLPRRIVFHIGDHKTGSTAIQQAFAEGRVRVGGVPVFYPGQMGHNHLRGHVTAWVAGKRPKKRAQAEDLFAQLAARIAAARSGCALISGEALEQVPAADLHAVIERFFAPVADEIAVVAYVRPHAPRLLSSFAEQVKIGNFSGGLEPFYDRMAGQGRLTYHARFSALRAAFGAAFTLRPFLRDQLAGGDVLADFAATAFGAEAEIAPGAQVANESLALDDLMRLRVIQAQMARQTPKMRHALGWELARQAGILPDNGGAPDANATRLHLHRALAERVHAECLADARAMDRDFLGGSPLLERDLDRARDAAPEAAQDMWPETWFSASELRSLTMLGQTMAGLFDVAGINWVQVLRQARVASVLGRGAGTTGPAEDVSEDDD